MHRAGHTFDAERGAECPRSVLLPPGDVERREFLKLMAASMALAGAGAVGGMSGCSLKSDEQIVPYPSEQNRVTPGVTRMYATAVTRQGYALGVLVRSEDGRPTKIEGNPDHPASMGATDAITQAELLNLWDPARSSVVRRDGKRSSWEIIEEELASRVQSLESSGGEGLHVVLGATTSPTLLGLIARAQRRLPRSRWFRHEPLENSSSVKGSRLAFGSPLTPVLHLDRTRTIISLDNDLFCEGPAAVRHAWDFASARRAGLQQSTLSPRLLVAEPIPTITGGRADLRAAIPRSRIPAVAAAIARAIGVPSSIDAPNPNSAEQSFADAAVRSLRDAGNTALLVAGPYQPPSVHAACFAVSHALGAIGSTIDLIEPIDGRELLSGTVADCAAALESGAVHTLLLVGVNPAFDTLANLSFATKMRRAGRVYHLGLWPDETAAASHVHAPLAHVLESWGDARAFDGTATILQPLVDPLGSGRSALWLANLLAGERGVPDRDLVRREWMTRLGEHNFEASWTSALRKGVLESSASRPIAVAATSSPAPAAANAPTRAAASFFEVTFHPDPYLLDGRHAPNAWLQELPRPITRLVWGNAALLSPATARQLNVTDQAIVSIGDQSQRIAIPALIVPGAADNTIALILGHGRRAAGDVGTSRGVDVSVLRRHASEWSRGDLDVSRIQRTGTLIVAQGHQQMEGRGLIKVLRPGQTLERDKTVHLPLYEHPAYNAPQQWGMVIDLAACIGCNACVAACQAENNIPVVGPVEVSRGRIMHWIRVDRYYDDASPSGMLFQPVPCMQCENAPCELVCPTGATQHSQDGLNDMNYARCIGTRYCQNNCPYKVRRFNFFRYSDRSPAPNSQPRLMRMRNPRVTVRARGVMEKCTYCVQRIRAAEMDARTKGTLIPEVSLQTACQQACATRAITFGDTASPATAVATLKRSDRNYSLLDDLNTKPRTTYLADVRNKPPGPAVSSGGDASTGAAATKSTPGGAA